MNVAQTILMIVAGYAGAGLLFAFVFVSRGITAIDETAKGSSAAFRALIVPGAAALWPVLLRKWRAASRGEVQHDTH